jgi:hypothetical protein
MKKLIIVILTLLVVIACDIDNKKDSKPDPIINPGDTPDNPITRIESRQLTIVAWVELLKEIEADGKYVALDLSACARGNQTTGGGLWSDGSFNPDEDLDDNNGQKGKKLIVSLILPETAICIPEPKIVGGSMGFPIYQGFFGAFSALKEVTGINITTLSRGSFSNLGTLYSSDGKITWNRGILTSINFPNVITIGENAFGSCYSLIYANIPKVQIIKQQAFLYCSLQSLNIPDIKYLGVQSLAFRKFAIEFIFGEVAPKIDYSVLYTPISGTTSHSITVKIPQGAAGYGEIPNDYIGGDTSKNWGNAFRGMGWNPDKANMVISSGTDRYDADGFGPINRIFTGISLRIEYIN